MQKVATACLEANELCQEIMPLFKTECTGLLKYLQNLRKTGILPWKLRPVLGHILVPSHVFTQVIIVNVDRSDIARAYDLAIIARCKDDQCNDETQL